MLNLSFSRILVVAVLGLAACGDKDIILPGERLDARAVLSPDGPAIEGPQAGQATRLRLAAARTNAEWSHRAGGPAHLSGNLALAGGGTARIWSANIGQPNDRRHRITADPIVAGGRIYTLDSRASVAATGLNGAPSWQRDVTPPGETRDSSSGGGIAYGAGQVFVTTGFGELVALDAATGNVQWRQRVAGPVAGAPTVADGVVYVATRNATGWAVRASDGKVMWQVSGIPELSGHTGVSAPAVDGDLVVFPFSSGQLLGVDRETGIERWSAQLAGTRVGRAVAYIRDVTGDPVIDGNVVYAGSSSGRIYAIDRETGIEIWSAREGALSPVLPIGGSVFAINDQSQLIRLDAANGGLIWARDLPWFKESRVKKQSAVYAHFGPVMANGRLYLSSSDGVLRIHDPVSGNPIGQSEIPGGAATAPVIAGGTLYVTGRNGQLGAYR